MLSNINVTPEQIQSAGQGLLQLQGNLSSSARPLTQVSPPEEAMPGSLVFVSDAKSFKSSVTDCAWIIADKLRAHSEVEQLISQGAPLWFTPSIPHAMSLVLGLFDRRALFRWDDFKSVGGAYIHNSAKIDSGVKIYPGVWIGPGCQIGQNSEIRPHVTLEALSILGSDCLVHAGTVIGSDGFGFFKNPKTGHTLKIPQIGHVELGRSVEVGSNCSIDRATLTATRVGDETKLDNLVHLAHNAQVGKGGFLAAGFMCAGSIQIGDNFACGGDVVVSDHIRICDNVTVGGRSGVIWDITKPGHYVGYPAEPWKEGLKTLNNLTHLSQMRKDLAELKKHIQNQGSNRNT